MKKRTKIVATVGPSCESVEVIENLIEAGVNVFRLNFSHGTYEYHEKVLNNIRKAMEITGKIVGVLQDISGPKIRIGDLEHSFELVRGDIIEFSREQTIGHMVADGHYKVQLNESAILDKINIGEYIYLYDGIIRARVKEKNISGSVLAEVENSGILSSKKGVNFPNTRLAFDILTIKDREDIKWGVKNEVDFMAISFVQCADDMLRARELVDGLGGKQMLIAKIEKFEALEEIDAILKESDGIMVARGDLGIEVPYYEVPNIQKMLIAKANAASKPVITATQMLLSMTNSSRATRAEISDIANAVMDGTDAVMLSEESAVGKHPVLAVETMFETIRETEKKYNNFRFGIYTYINPINIIDESAVRLAKELQAEAILTITSSGNSARKLSKYRPVQPIYAITHDEVVRSQLTLSWGVVPIFSVQKSSLPKIMQNVMKKGFDENILHIDAGYILTAGDPTGVSGSTNMIRYLRKYEMEMFLNQECDNNTSII